MAAPVLPTRFPCWVKAVYSWGGETKRDLGFMEGDLIECLNAGDGMWWMGRLRRDRRMIGLFPSNFVKILDDSFQPAPNRSSPISSVAHSRQSTPPTDISSTSSAHVSPHKTLFRKPFQAYTSGGSHSLPGSATKNSGSRSPLNSANKRHMPRPFSSMKEVEVQSSPPPALSSRPPSPTIPPPIPRAGSSRSRLDFERPSRAVSPAFNETPTRQTSFSSYDDNADASPPPPPPPAHRVSYNTSANAHHHNYEHLEHYVPSTTPRQPSPAPSNRTAGMTPSPLREAMKDVMTSLEGMSVTRQCDETEYRPRAEPTNMWSPEAFDELYASPTKKPRPHTSQGMERQQRHYQNDDYQNDDSYQFNKSTHEACSQFADSQHANYVQRMESRLRRMQQEDSMHNKFTRQEDSSPSPPPLPPKGSPHTARPVSALAHTRPKSSYMGTSNLDNSEDPPQASKTLKTRKSAYELGKAALSRTFTVKSNGTSTSSNTNSSSANNSNSTQITSQSLMSGHSAGGFSATSAGSLARRKFGRSDSIKERPISVAEVQRPHTAASAFSFQSNDDLDVPKTGVSSSVYSSSVENNALFGGLSTPSAKKRGFLTKMIDSVKTGAASARTNMGSGQSSRPSSPFKNTMPQAVSSGKSSHGQGKDLAREMGLGGGNEDWVQMRRDVNRSNSLSRIERTDRIERCQMMDIPVLTPVDTLYDSAQGDEASDGSVVSYPTDFTLCNLSLVEKGARFVDNLPVVINSSSLAQVYLCRPYRSEVQKLRAIFTWVTERLTLEEDFDGQVDTRRVIQTRRGCAQEIAVLVSEMCLSVGIQAEVVRGRLKFPNEAISPRHLSEEAAQPNHWWNAVIVDGEWRIMDCALASPKNPHRSAYTSSASSQTADSWWFLARPMEICYTHVPLLPRDQHIVPPMPHEILMALPVASPAFFKNQLQLWDFDTSLLHLDALEMAHIQISVPDGVECTAEVEARAFLKDSDGDLFESGEVIRKRALAQGEFITVNDNSSGDGQSIPFKRYTIKAVLPAGDASNIAILKIYAGKRGLQHSISSNPHSIALSLPLNHTGPNPPYEFFARHPTPHALRNEIYVTGPLCKRLVYNSTFVFGVRQHPSRSGRREDHGLGARARSPGPSRPGSALSMNSISVSGSASSNTPSNSSNESASDAMSVNQEKPAKLAIQSPSGKILRMTRKIEQPGRRVKEVDDEDGVTKVGSQWETIIKIGERGVWRGLVLADRSARWCVFGEWECF